MEQRDRGRRNTNERGSAAQRRRRRQWLLDSFGDGDTAPCQAPTPEGTCGMSVDIVTLFVGRIIPGHKGGRYTRDNIRPECGPCSCREGAVLSCAARVIKS